jgi:hypothetical protein
MNRRSVGLGLVSASLVAALGACGGADSRPREVTSSASSGLTTSGFLPYPVKVVSTVGPDGGPAIAPALDPAGNPIPVWDGSIVELMAADALTECAANAPAGMWLGKDKYLAHLASSINNAACSPASPLPTPATIDGFTIAAPNAPGIGRWAVNRLTAACNADPSSGKPKTLKLVNMTRHTVPAAIEATGTRRAEVEAEVNYAEINLCMAQRLREVGASGDALFLSADDQRQLLEVTRERAQIAMLQYAALGNVLAYPLPAGSAAPTNDYQVVPALSTWGHSALASDVAVLKDLGLDFANAVQLHVIASRELSDLLWRSASAKLPRGGNVATAADDAWGPGGWRQRLMALLYGGDPLVQAPPQEPSAPWKHFDEANVTYPGDGKLSIFGLGAGTLTWPGAAASPAYDHDPLYVHTSDAAPESSDLLSFARRFDVLNFKLASDGTPQSGRADVDVDASATQLYKAVEASLAFDDCRKTSSSTCSFSAALAALAGDDLTKTFCSNGTCGYDGYRLWTRHRIRPQHAHDLVSQIGGALPKAILKNGAVDATQLNWPGALRVVGAGNAMVDGGAIGGKAGDLWYHVDGSASLVPLGNVERAPLYARLTAYRIPLLAGPDSVSVQAQGQGLIGHMASDESPRILGAIPALGAVRDAIRMAVANAPTAGQAASSFFGRSDKILALVDAAIGSTTLSVTPTLIAKQGRVDEAGGQNRPLDGCWPYSSSTTCWLYVQDGTSSGSSPTASWDVGVTVGVEDAFASPTGATLVVVPGGWLTSTLASPHDASHTWKTLTGKTIDMAVAAGVSTSGTRTLLTPSGGHPLVHQRFTVQLPIGAGPTKYSFLLQLGSGATAQYRVLGEDMELKTLSASLKNSTTTSVNYPVEGQYIAEGGDLGTIARHAWATVQAYSPEPSYDGFGLPMRWIPPADPRLVGGGAEGDAASHYLSSARQAADEATAAVKSAMDELLKEEADDAALAQAQRRASAIDDMEQRGLCGDENPQCDTTTAAVTPRVPLYTSDCLAPTVDNPMGFPLVDELAASTPDKKREFYKEYDDLCTSFEATARGFINAGGTTFTLAKVVQDQQYATVAPDFAAYKGGSMQAVLINQWQALHHVENTASSLAAAAGAAWARIDEAYRLNAFKKYKTVMACGRDIYVAIAAGASVSVGSTGVGFSWSPGPLLQAMSACEDAKNEESIVGDSPFVSALTSSFSELSSLATVYSDALSALQEASAAGDRTIHEASLAKARADLEASLAKDTQLTKLKTYRRYHSYDMWRAKALLESARRYGVAARRAVEGRFVVDLSSMRGDEPFVASPSSWADEIYEYDLDAPSAVGLTALPRVADGVYPNRISDYMGNLERFVNGYAIARPTAVAKSDNELLSIGGPDERAQGAVAPAPLTEDARRWELQCPDGTWTTRVAITKSGNTPPAERTFAQLCAGAVKPVRARVSFTLDPWGRIDGDLGNQPFTQRFNARWARLALNVVGTGVLECELADKPADCYGQPYLSFDLAHTGPAWTTSFEQIWRVLTIDVGRIEAGKALAAEQWLDPVNNGWGRTYVDAVARTELAERPFGGAYQLELDLGPEAHPERIDRVQILVQSTYWVKQQ